MPDSLARRQTTDLVFPQDPTPEFIQHTQEQLETVRSLVGMGIVEYDRMFSDMKAYGESPGRSPDHQNYIASRGAALLHIHNTAAETIIRTGLRDTLDNRFVKEVEVTRIREIPARGILPWLFGK